MAIFTNMATLTYNGTSTDSNVTTGFLLENVTITKTPVVSEYTRDSRVTYVVSIVNTGAVALTDLTLTDNLGAYENGDATLYPLGYTDGSIQYYVNGTLQADPAVTSGPPMVVTGISVPAGGNATLIYEAEVNRFAPLGVDASVVNTVTLTGDDVQTEVSASATITTTDEPRLSISKAMDPTTVTSGDTLTYTFVIQNTGNTAADAEDALTLTDTFDPRLENITVTFNGVRWVAGTNYTYNEETGEFATVTGQLTVPAATYTQDPATGAWTTNPGYSTLTVTGTV